MFASFSTVMLSSCNKIDSETELAVIINQQVPPKSTSHCQSVRTTCLTTNDSTRTLHHMRENKELLKTNKKIEI